MASVAELQQEYVPPNFGSHYCFIDIIYQYYQQLYPHCCQWYVLCSIRSSPVILIDIESLVVFFYDCVITLCEEVNVVWRRKWTTMTWIYTLTRYSTLLLNILTFPLGSDTISV